jgi:lipid-A-disaccharide synthase-like uncharacterized protein
MYIAVWLADETEPLREFPLPAWLYGVIGFGILLVMLIGTLAFGKGRPHS